MIGTAWLIPRMLHEKVGKWDETLSVHDDYIFFAKCVIQVAFITIPPEISNNLPLSESPVSLLIVVNPPIIIPNPAIAKPA